MTTKTTFCQIEDLQYSPGSGKITRAMYAIPDSYEVVETHTRLKNSLKRLDLIGRSTRLTKTQFLSILFLRNEINACTGKPVSQDIIFRQLRKEFPQWELKQAKSFFRDISKYRKRYNERKLYSGQPSPILYSFYYNDNGYICHHLRRKDMMTFDLCRSIVELNKFADPRFFTKKELSEMRQKLLKAEKENIPSSFTTWTIPNEIEVETVEANIKKPLFNSITFADGFQYAIKSAGINEVKQ
jgi:hypothetical protein